jgi:hypothetical protein
VCGTYAHEALAVKTLGIIHTPKGARMPRRSRHARPLRHTSVIVSVSA